MASRAPGVSVNSAPSRYHRSLSVKWPRNRATAPAAPRQRGKRAVPSASAAPARSTYVVARSREPLSQALSAAAPRSSTRRGCAASSAWSASSIVQIQSSDRSRQTAGSSSASTMSTMASRSPRRARDMHRHPQVRHLTTQPPICLRLALTAQVPAKVGGPRPRPAEKTRLGRAVLAAGLQLLGQVRADSLEHGVVRVVSVRRDHQRAVHEAAEDRQRIALRHLPRELLDRVQVRPAGHRCESQQHQLLVRMQEPERPLDGVVQRAVPGLVRGPIRGQRVQRTVQSGAKRRQGHRRGLSGGELDRERQAVEPAHDVSHNGAVLDGQSVTHVAALRVLHERGDTRLASVASRRRLRPLAAAAAAAASRTRPARAATPVTWQGLARRARRRRWRSPDRGTGR